MLHFVDTLQGGGTERMAMSLIARTLDELEHFVACVRSGGPMAEALPASGVPLHHLGKRPGNDWRVALRAAGLCRRLRPDVVHTRGWGCVDGIVGAALARVPVVHSEHGFEVGSQGRANLRRHRIRRLLAPWVHRILAVSEDLKRSLVQEGRLPPDKIQVVHNGVDTARYRPCDSRARIRRDLGCGVEDFVVGAVARLVPERDHIGLIDAFGGLVRQHPDSRLILVGAGPSEKPIRSRLEELGLASRALVLGQREDVPRLLNIFDVFVLPSLFEGTSNALLEAMAVGLPVVATRVGGNPELVLQNQTGLLVRPRDPAGLTDAMRFYSVNRSERLRHGEAGRRRVEESFSLDRMVRSYVSVYMESLATGAHSTATSTIEPGPVD